MSQSHPWQFDPICSLTDDDVHELNKMCGNLQASDCDDMSASLAKHFVNEDTQERGEGRYANIDPDEAYERAMSICS